MGKQRLRTITLALSGAIGVAILMLGAGRCGELAPRHTLRALRALPVMHFGASDDRPIAVMQLRRAPCADVAALPWVVLHLADRNPLVRRTCADVLREMKPVSYAAAPALIVSLYDPDVIVRANASRTLGELGFAGRIAVPFLLTGMLDNEWTVRERCAQALARLGAGRRVTVPCLTSLLASGDAHLRRRVVLALDAAMGGERHALAARIRRAEASDVDDAWWPEQIRQATWDLEARIVAALARATTDAEAPVRGAAIVVLAGVPRDCALRQVAEDALIAALDDADPDMRRTAMEGLLKHRCRAPDFLPRIVAALGDPRDDVRRVAARSLEPFGEEGRVAVEPLTAMLAGNAPELPDAVRALGVIGPPARVAVPALSRLLRNSDRHTRRLAATALGRIGAPGVRALVRAANDADEDTIAAVCAGLRETHKSDPEALPSLIRALDHPNSEVRRAAMSGIGRLGDDAESAVAPLFRFVTNPDAELRRSAISALWSIDRGIGDASERVGRMLHADDADRTAAAWGLARATPDAMAWAEPHLRAMMTTTDPVTASILGFALATAGDDRAGQVAALIEVVKLARNDERVTAFHWLGRLGQAATPAIPILREMAQLSDADTRVPAESALADIKRATEDVARRVRDLGGRSPHARARAATTLGDVCGPSDAEAVAALRVATDDRDPAVREAARAALARINNTSTKE